MIGSAKYANTLGHLSSLGLAFLIIMIFWGYYAPKLYPYSAGMNWAFQVGTLILVAMLLQVNAVAARRLSGDRETTNDNLISMVPLVALIAALIVKGYEKVYTPFSAIAETTGKIEIAGIKVPEWIEGAMHLIVLIGSAMPFYLWWVTLMLVVYFIMDLRVLPQLMNRLLLTTDEAVISRFR